MEFPTVHCSVRIESSSQIGLVNMSNYVKTCQMNLFRNKSDEIVLKVHSNKNILTYDMKDVVIHDRFVDKGQATFRFPNKGVQVLVTNAPPNDLLKFLKGLSYKLKFNLKMAPNEKSPCSKFISRQTDKLNEISPLSSIDIKKIIGKNTSPLIQNNTRKLSSLSACVDSPSAKKPKVIRSSFKNNMTCLSNTKVSGNESLANLCKSMSDEQKVVLKMIEQGKNIFLTGGAGTGKSFLLQRIIGSLSPQSTIVTASTGIAASQINGLTIHSAIGINNITKPFEYYIRLYNNKRELLNKWKSCRHLIIDEISMIEGDYFDYMEEFLRRIRNNSKNFGGIQLIVCGDFLQLPPVNSLSFKRKNHNYTMEKKMCFEARCWEESINVCCELTRVYRQDDSRFVDILNEIRVGKLSDASLKILNDTFTNNLKSKDITPTILCTHKSVAHSINEKNNFKLQQQEMVFNAIDCFNHADSSQNYSISSSLKSNYFPVDTQVKLKIGSQVMLCKNLSINQNLVNGSIGHVVSFDYSLKNYPVVQFKNGVRTTIQPETFLFIDSINNLTYKRTQIPLYLAWAISIHKSQGMTIECLEVNLSNLFECGQAYVALSRAKTLDSIRIIDININHIKANLKCLEYYNKLHSKTKL